MRRVILITTSFPAHPGDASGHFVAAEAEELALAGHDVHVICPGAHPRGKGEHGSITVHGCGGGDAFGWPGSVARIRERPWRAAGAARFIRDARKTLDDMGRVDEVRAHWLVPSAWPIAGHHPVRVMCHGGDVRLLCRLPTPVRNRILSDVIARAQHIAFAGRHLRSQLLGALDGELARRLDDKSSVQAPMLVVAFPHPDERRRTRARLSTDPSVPIISVVGRLVPGKRVDLAIRAIAAMPSRARLVIIGDGPAKTRLEALAAELGVDARFEGQRDRDETHELIAASNILLHTSEAEGAPSVVREARVLGTRVVATASGDLASWAERDPAIHIAEATPSALAHALTR